jgi:two-component system, response regulator
MTNGPIDILLVEDNPDGVTLALYALKRHNMANHIDVVRDGAEALEYLFCTGAYATRKSEEQPKVILLDLKLPKVDGLEVLRRIKADPRTQALPVVILTSSHQECDITQSYQLGANSYMVKPVDFEQFAQALGTLGIYWLLLNRRPPLSDRVEEVR